MSRLRSLLNTSAGLALIGAAACGGGGGGDSCGPGGAPGSGLVASGGAVTLTYGNLVGGINNDCPAADAPAGVISMTIHGTQSDGTGQITLCVARPDLLATQAQALGHDVAGAAIRVIDIAGTATSCSFKVDRAQPVTGSATSSGLCLVNGGNASDPAGFALVLDGALALTRTCGATVDSLGVTLRGRVAVAAD